MNAPARSFAATTPATVSSPVKAARPAFRASLRDRRNRQSLAAALVVATFHASALYALTHTDPVVGPAASVPMTISIITEDTSVTPKRVRTVKPKAPAPIPKVTRAPAAISEPEPPKPSAEPVEEIAKSEPAEKNAAPPPVQAPRFDAAYLNNPTPIYPRLAQSLREEGIVKLRVFVNADGTPGQILVDASSGSPRLDRAAKEAVERWKFLPARQGAQAVGAWVVVPVNFSLSQSS